MALPEIKNRNLFFNKGVNLESVAELSKSIIEINKSDEENSKLFEIQGLTYSPKPIELYIDSYGGMVYQCLGLLGIMENSKTPIHTIVTGCAMSCGFLISVAGTKRYAYKNSTFMYHQLSSIKIGELKDIEDGVIESKRLQKIIENHTLNHTSITAKKLKEIYNGKQDWFMDSGEALKNGVIDKIK